MSKIDLRNVARIGLLAGVVAVSVSAIGMVQAFDQRDLIAGVLTLGQVLLFLAPALGGYYAARQYKDGEHVPVIASGALAGLLSSLPLVLLIRIALIDEIRRKLISVTPALLNILTFDAGEAELLTGTLLLVVALTLLGLAGALVNVVPKRVSQPIVKAVIWTLVAGMLSEVLVGVLRPLLGARTTSMLFATRGLRPPMALTLFVVLTGLFMWWRVEGRKGLRQRLHTDDSAQAKRVRLISVAVIFFALLLLPIMLGTYLTEVLDNVGLYILMGLGLNIVVGFAGLLDLGYVAFFAIGAYVMGILTSQGPLGIVDMSFWIALPIAVVTSVIAGLILGTPVLRMRGDYLAIVTLGFGEIIRVMATSDVLKPYIGGAQGILQIRKPSIFDFRLVQPEEFYYLILLSGALAAFVSWRLRDARLGRQWMALREDEDVAEAMGINLVKTKLLAFGIGAAFSGLAGAIFASRLSSIFPHSFNLLISINVLSLIIVGGLGSLPGVVVGALVLVGMPELLREFGEYRLLMYGVLLILMMVTRPEGLWPSPVIRRELARADEVDITVPEEESDSQRTREPVAEQVVEQPSTATK